MPSRRPVLLAPLVALLAVGCEPEVTSLDVSLERTAIVTGDFDDVEQLIRDVQEKGTVDAELQFFDGYIVGPAIESEPPNGGRPLELQVEDLLRSSTDGLQQFETVFLSDGMRGCNRQQYNGAASDDHLVTDQTVVDNLALAVQNGLRVYFSDWNYDLLEATWPELVDWIGDDLELDAAQRGLGSQTVTARIVDDGLADFPGVAIGSPLDVVFNFDTWAVIDSVHESVDVLVRGDVTYEDPVTGEQRTKEDAPLLLSAQVGDGVVLFTAFHNEPQISEAVQDVLAYGITRLSR